MRHCEALKCAAVAREYARSYRNLYANAIRSARFYRKRNCVATARDCLRDAETYRAEMKLHDLNAEAFARIALR